jgi:FtsH-binding integral membrane protein
MYSNMYGNVNENTNELNITNSNMHNNQNSNIEWKQVDYPNKEDLEQSGNDSPYYSEAYIRTGFIKKVYGILSFQMIITTLMCILAMSLPGYSKFQLSHTWLLWASFIFSIATIVSLSCFRDLSRKVPLNYILLILFTMSKGYMISFVCNLTQPRIVFMAACMTCFITLALTFYACTTKRDFTIYGSLMFLLSCVLLLFSIFYLFTQNRLIHIVVSCIGVLIFSFYLIYDTQLLIGNKENAMDTDDYILCSIMLYIDIVNLFFYIIDILKSSSD